MKHDVGTECAAIIWKHLYSDYSKTRTLALCSSQRNTRSSTAIRCCVSRFKLEKILARQRSNLSEFPQKEVMAHTVKCRETTTHLCVLELTKRSIDYLD